MSEQEFTYNSEADLEGTEEVTEYKTLAPGFYLAEIQKNEFRASKAKPEEDKKSKLMAVVEFGILEPSEFAGQEKTEYFVLGNEDMPTSFVKDQFGSRRWKTMLTKARVQMGNDIDQAALQSTGSRLVISVTCKAETYTNNEGDVKPTIRNNITGFYAVNERKPQITGEIPVIEIEGVNNTHTAASDAPPTQFVAPTGGVVRPKANVQTVTCPTCGQAIPVGEFSAHVATCGK